IAPGTPMLLAGDEASRTQRGNKNAHCQDNDISWFDWALAETPQGKAMTRFAARVIALRREHPLLHETRFLFGERELMPGVHDIDWFDERGEPLSPEAWHDPEASAFTMRRAGAGLHGQMEVLLMMLNASHGAVPFVAPAPRMAWEVLLDTARPDAVPYALPDTTYELAARALAVLCARPARADTHRPAGTRGDAATPDPRRTPGASGSGAPAGPDQAAAG
ncbi:glycogen debranching enzyme GlgX, partial [Paraburkholderia sp. BR14262]